MYLNFYVIIATITDIGQTKCSVDIHSSNHEFRRKYFTRNRSLWQHFILMQYLFIYISFQNNFTDQMN